MHIVYIYYHSIIIVYLIKTVYTRSLLDETLHFFNIIITASKAQFIFQLCNISFMLVVGESEKGRGGKQTLEVKLNMSYNT
jgi:hypothetical protein